MYSFTVWGPKILNQGGYMVKLYLQGFKKMCLCFSISGGSWPFTDCGCINQLDVSVTRFSLLASVSLYKGGDEGMGDPSR